MLILFLNVSDDGSKVSEEETASLDSRISITGCDKPPCRLRQKTVVTGEFRFTPSKLKLKTNFFRDSVNLNRRRIFHCRLPVCSTVADQSEAQGKQQKFVITRQV